MQTHHAADTSIFNSRVLRSILSPDVIGNWTQDAVIEQGAITFIDNIAAPFGQKSKRYFPEAESLGARDIVTLAELVGRIGGKRFGKALKSGLDVNRLTDAVKSGSLNLEKLIADFDEGMLDSRVFGAEPPVSPNVSSRVSPRATRRDSSGYSRRDLLEMSAAYKLDHERDDWACIAVTTDDLLDAREANARWPSVDELEKKNVDIVALERVRSIIGTQGLARLYAAGFNLSTLAYRVRYGLDVAHLFAAFEAQLVKPTDLSRIKRAALRELAQRAASVSVQ
jgi:hypothetical protein